MTNVSHASLSGADLHEPKGIGSAANNTVYIANGLGSGVWTDVNAAISNTAWTTGDVKFTLQSSAPATWILFAESGTIGDGSSGASIRANADTSALYVLFWNAYSNVACPVTGGRGASAAADFAAHKKLQLPPMAGRTLQVSGQGQGLPTAWSLGQTVGAETHTLTASEIPTITSGGSATGSISVSSGGTTVWQGTSGASSQFGGAGPEPGAITTLTSTGTANLAASVTSNNTGGGSHSIQGPRTTLNLLIKL